MSYQLSWFCRRLYLDLLFGPDDGYSIDLTDLMG
jgi:hypothetical protein